MISPSDNEDGVIVDYNVEAGNPPDAEQLAPAIRRIKRRAGRAPRTVVADRGYGEAAVEDEIREEGVRYPVLPAKADRRQHVARSKHDGRSANTSDGASEAKNGSAASNATSGSTAHASTASTAPAPGAATACSPTTSSRSAASSPESRARTGDAEETGDGRG